MRIGSSSRRVPSHEELELLRESTRGFLTRHESHARVRAGLESERVPDPDRWRAAAGMGWVGAVLPGDEDASLIDAVLIAEELGRGLYGGPFPGTAAVAHLVAHSGGPATEQLDKLANGTLAAAWCVDATARGWRTPGVRAAGTDRGWTFDGSATLVADADIADVLLVTASHDDGPVSVLVAADAPGVLIVVQPSLDLTRRVARVELESVIAPPEALVGSGAEHAARLAGTADLAALLVAADAVGCAQVLMERTVEYALQRVAFGRVIGSYQAVKHRCADMLCAVESGRLLVRDAARALDLGDDRAPTAVRAAAAHAGEHCAAVCGESLQIHGGIGFTWEHDLHLYLRRAKADEALYGTPDEHYTALGDRLFDGVASPAGSRG